MEQNVVVNNSIPDTTSTIDKLIDKLPTFTPKDDTASDFNACVKNIKDDFEKLKKDIVSFGIFVQTLTDADNRTDDRSPSTPDDRRPGGHLLSDHKTLGPTSKGKIGKFLHQRRLDNLFDQN